VPRLTLGILALLYPWAAAAQSSGSPETAAAPAVRTVAVTVTDRELGIPLEGAELELTGAGMAAQKASTDEAGQASFKVPDPAPRMTLRASFPGYGDYRGTLPPSGGKIDVALSISDVIEGRELVVERSAPGKSDQKSGISVAMNREEMDTTANIGLVEDIMSSVGTLPGVGFTGGWNSMPSVRGGYPEEMGTVMDGVYMPYPWHWGGAFSIFNPYMVDAAKMSNGVFSARYGRAMSGLLEVTTLTPEPGQVRVEGGISTTSTDLFAQIPFSSSAALLIGGKVTYLESLALLNDYALRLVPPMSESIPTMPFIRDFYTKGSWAPSDTLKLSLNGFFGSDGVGVHSEASAEGVTTLADFDWLNLQGFLAADLRWMPADFAVVRLQGGWNNQTMDMSMYFDRFGERDYSAAFLDQFDGRTFFLLDGTTVAFSGQTGYTIPEGSLTFSGFSRQTLNQVQGKLETEFQAAKGHVLSLGAEEVFQVFRSKQEMKGWSEFETGADSAAYTAMEVSTDLEGNKTVDTALYGLWNFGSDTSLLSGELGLRAEHFFLWNRDYELNTYPVANPRATVQWRPRAGLTLSAGSGFFSMFPLDAVAAEDKYGIKSFEAGPNRAWFNVLGAELSFADSWSFRIETYYKQWFDRLYTAFWQDPDTLETRYAAKTDGTGYAAGFDLMLKRKTSRLWDGYLTYSFVTSQFLNPMDPPEEGMTDLSGDPLGRWYYPSFHRFHSMNLILNWKPARGLTFTAKARLASGTPKPKAGNIEMYAAVAEDGTVVEQYRRDESYDPDLRTELSCPVDLRVSFSNYYRNSKVRWEYYIGAEDVFVNLYSPKTNASFDPFTGEEQPDSDSADFGIGIPQISVGYKLSY